MNYELSGDEIAHVMAEYSMFVMGQKRSKPITVVGEWFKRRYKEPGIKLVYWNPVIGDTGQLIISAASDADLVSFKLKHLS